MTAPHAHDRRRSGLTLVETLAATALLATIAAACAALLGDIRKAADDRRLTEEARVSGCADALIESIMERPQMAGVRELASLSDHPTRVHLTQADLGAVLARLGSTQALTQPSERVPDVSAWLVPSSVIAVPGVAAPLNRPGRDAWLCVQVGDELAIRAVRLRGARP